MAGETASMLALARSGISLDIFDDLPNLGDLVTVARARGAFLSYDAAVYQEREQVVVILYVAVECLTNPFQCKTERLASRFVNFFDQLMPQDLDALVPHGNFEQAFGVVRGGRDVRVG
ncbi:MAG TPA: hypothetical protein VLZ05_17485 [Mycobacterium sp.]|nr:hypothetical protein [Mycobacterium sp.]HUH70487.1 hypothetical protein [Mycobacterium sp.]